MSKQPQPPFRVDIVDQFNGHCEDGYGKWATFHLLSDAVAEASRITTDAIRDAGSFAKWDGMGDAGLVYDATGRLVWDGIAEARKTHTTDTQ